MIRLGKKDLPNVIELVKLKMGKEVGEQAEKSMVEDVPERMLWGEYSDDGELLCVCGFYDGWDREDRFWVSWFASRVQRQGKGKMMIDFLEKTAKEMGKKSLYIETYLNEQFLSANKFYQKMGYIQVCYMNDYLKDGSPVVYYGKTL